MSERRTHYIVLCKNCNLSCNCCKSCKNLKFDEVKYKNKRGYHYRAPKSITFKSAMERLKALDVTDFELVAVSWRKKVSKSENSLVNQGLKRPAPSEQNFDEEALIKKLKASLLEELKIETSKGSSELDRKWKQKISRLEENHQKTALEVSYHGKQILGIIKTQEARDKQFAKTLDTLAQIQVQVSQSNTDSARISAQISKDVKDGIKNGIQDGVQVAFTKLLSQQSAQMQESLQSFARKKPGQTRNSNSGGTTSVPPSAGQSRPQFINPSEPTGQRGFPFLQTLGPY